MNDSPRKDLSVYRLALGVEAPPQSLPVNSAILLSMLRSHIDLLIEQQIAATFWVKLPPGKMWNAELARYQSSVSVSSTIYNCQIQQRENIKEGGILNFASSYQYINLLLPPHSKLQREYFFIMLSPQFCSLTVAHRPRKIAQTRNLEKVNPQKTESLMVISTVEGRIIQQVLNGIQQVIASESSIVPADFICPSAAAPALLSRLLTKQLQRQDEINRQIQTKRLANLQQQNQRLHEKEQLKDEYLSNVCQQIRTPLTHMKTALSLLNSPNLKPPQRQRYLQMLNTECDRQSTLVTGLLTLVELEHNLDKTSLETVKLSDIVPGVVSTYQPVATEKGIMLAYTIPNELPAVWCVHGGLRQIVIHLLHNSIKFTSKGGQVWVRTRVQGDYVQLEFRDTGIGIAENDIPNIFECFYRGRSGATEDFGSAGLGLTIVQRLLWRCGGSISVKSKLDEGSTFTVQLRICKTQN